MDLLIPGDNLIYDVGDLIVAIVESIYLSIADNYRTNKYFENRVILSPTHREVECINEGVLSVMPSDTREYLSSDSICRSEFRSEGRCVDNASQKHRSKVRVVQWNKIDCYEAWKSYT
ncbi:hypothetical protein ACS0TY_005505 [Phlomoides rotata]